MNWKKDEIVLVINRDARRAITRAKTVQIQAKKHRLKTITCSGSNLDYTIRQVLENQKLKRMIIAGGDGSVSLATSLVRRNSPNTEIAVLPLGTANYYARSLGIGRSLPKAFDIATQGKPEKRYVCTANNRDFIIGLNVGATSQMFAEITDRDKQRLGKLAYIRGLLKVILNIQPLDVTVKANNKTKTYVSTEVVILNQSFKDRIKLTPDVSGTEPFFEIVTYGLGNSKLSPLYATIIFAITLGRNQKYLQRICATEATITTKKPEIVSVDGDSLCSTPLEVKVIKKPVLLIADRQKVNNSV